MIESARPDEVGTPHAPGLGHVGTSYSSEFLIEPGADPLVLGGAIARRVRPRDSAVLTGLYWKRGAARHADPRVNVDCVVTRCRWVAKDRTAVWHQVVSVADDVCQFELVWQVPDCPRPAAAGDERDVASIGWAERITVLLERDDRFRHSAATFDGAIGIRSGDSQIAFRVYRGAIVEVARRLPSPVDFVIMGPDIAWVGLLDAGSNEYIRRVSRRDFTVEGSSYQYLRLTASIMLIVDAGQELWRSVL